MVNPAATCPVIDMPTNTDLSDEALRVRLQNGFNLNLCVAFSARELSAVTRAIFLLNQEIQPCASISRQGRITLRRAGPFTVNESRLPVASKGEF
jgi:hypothetical protein